ETRGRGPAGKNQAGDRRRPLQVNNDGAQNMAVKQREKGVAGKATGEIFRVAGPVVTATGLRPRMYDVQFVGEEQLLGEAIQIMGDKTVIQVYEDTSGVKPGVAVMDTGAHLVVELGPGLLGIIYDGVTG